MSILKTLTLICSMAFAQPAKKPDLVAINVLLRPDTKMVSSAQSVNTKLKENNHQGFSLDESHIPHISLVQAYVYSSDVNAVFTAVNKAIKDGVQLPLKLEVTGLETSKMGELSVLSYTIKKNQELSQLAQIVLKAVGPFAHAGGTTAAFVNKGDEPINEETVKYVETYLTEKAGEKYSPHLTLGVAQDDFVKKLKDKPINNFEFKAESVAIYQLGNFGTAQKKLWP
jgi:hypothetical protein